MNSCSTAAQTLACFECVCITWQSIFGLVLPIVIAATYLPRVLRETSIDDWVILAFATIFTFASRKTSSAGIAHQPWMLYIVVMWSCIALTTERTASLRSLPVIWFLVFLNVLIPDLVSVQIDRPSDRIGIPGGGGLLDGLVLKPLIGLAVTWVAYIFKIRPVLPNRHRRGKGYDAEALDFLLNVSPAYRRPDSLEARLTLRPLVEPPRA